MKWFKLFASLLISFVVIVALAIGSILLVINPQKFQTTLINLFHDKTGHELIIPGKLRWSFYPQLGLRADQVYIARDEKKKVLIDARKVIFRTDYLAPKNQSHFTFQMKMKELHYLDLRFENVSLDIDWQAPVLRINAIQAKFYQGELNGSLITQKLQTEPHWQFQIAAKDVELAPLLADILDEKNKLKLSGLARINLQGETSGIDKSTWLKQLNANGDVYVKNGVILGIDLDYFVKSAEVIVKKDNEARQSLTNMHQTTFDDMSATFLIHQGIAETNNLLLRSKALAMTSSGQIELDTNALDFQIEVKSLMGPNAWRIPLKINGTLQDPEIVLDPADLHHILTSEQIKKTKQKALEKINKHLNGKAGEFLQHLLR